MLAMQIEDHLLMKRHFLRITIVWKNLKYSTLT